MLVSGEDFQLKHAAGVDIVIVGAGAAGITSAMEFARLGRKVLLLEAGGLPPDDSRFEYFEAENNGRPYDVIRTRYRALGGATNVWNGYCRPLDRQEMQFQPWIGGLPWPMTHAALLPFQKRAAAMLALGPWEWNAAGIARSQGQSSLSSVPGANAVLSSVVWRFAGQPLSFAERYRAFLEGPQSTVVLNAPVVRVNTRAGRARSLDVRLASGRRVRINFKTLILAGGGIENVRLLLEMQSQSRGAENRVDRSGWLGRGWQEHPHAPIGTAFIPRSIADGPLWLFTRRRMIADVTTLAGFAFPKQVLEQQRMGSISITAAEWPAWSDSGVPLAAGVRLLAEQTTGEEIVARTLYARTESRTLRDSRIALSDARDPIGRRQAQLVWQVADGDFRDLAVSADLIGRAFAQLGLGVVHADASEEKLKQILDGGAHHIGGARMSRNPRTGVTNSFGAVHQIPNIYVTGSATFPSGGFSNPTLTIMALALRQAQHIAARSAA